MAEISPEETAMPPEVTCAPPDKAMARAADSIKGWLPPEAWQRS